MECSKENCHREAREDSHWCSKCHAIAMQKLWRRRKREEAIKRRKEREDAKNRCSSQHISETGQPRETD